MAGVYINLHVQSQVSTLLGLKMLICVVAFVFCFSQEGVNLYDTYGCRIILFSPIIYTNEIEHMYCTIFQYLQGFLPTF